MQSHDDDELCAAAFHPCASSTTTSQPKVRMKWPPFFFAPALQVLALEKALGVWKVYMARGYTIYM